MATYTTIDGDRLDLICWKHYGRTHGAVEEILRCNPRLALQPPVLPDGVKIELPNLDRQSEVRTIKRVWS